MRKQETTIEQLLGLVDQDYTDNRRKSRASLVVHIDKHLVPHLGPRSAGRLRFQDVEAYKTTRLAEGASRATVNLELSTLGRAYTLGIEREWLTYKPKISKYHVNNARQGFFEREQYDRQLKAFEDLGLRYAQQLFKFAYLSGWRFGEVIALRWDVNYDNENKVIRIYDSKSGEGRVLPLEGDLLGVVLEAVSNANHKGCPFIFHYNGGRVRKSTFSQHWHKACGKSGVKLKFHDLRRTAVRNMMRAGVHKAIAKQISGHKTDEVFDRYDIVDEKDIVGALAKVGKYLHQQVTQIPTSVDTSGQNGSGNGQVIHKIDGPSTTGEPAPQSHSPSKLVPLLAKIKGWFKKE